MDIYQIMARLDAIGSKKSLTESQDMMQPVAEGRFKELDIILQDYPEDVEEFKRTGELSSDLYDALFGFYEDQMDYGTAKARTGDPYNFIADKLSDALGLDEAYEKLPADQLGLDKFSQAALAGGQRKRDALANPNQTRMLAKKSAQQQPVREAGEAFAKGDRVMYLNGFATVVSQDGDAYVVKVDGQPNTMKVPATAIKKPSYNEGVAEGDDSVLPLLKKFISMKSDPADRQDMIKVYRAFQQGMPQGFETLSNQWGTNLDAEFYHFAKQQGVDMNDIARKHGVLKDSVAESKKSKPDFLDMDKDGDKKEPMKKAVADKKKGAVKESEQNMSRAAKGYEKYGKQGMQALAKAGKEGKSLDPIRKKYDKYDESAKPDFLDLDKDGNKKEPMKKAARDKNDAKGSFQKQMGGSAGDLTKGLSIGAKKVDEASKNLFPGTPEYELRFGKDDASSAFDKKKISTGTVYTRKHQEEPEAADDNDTPKKKGRPVGAKRRLGAKGPGVNSKLLKGKGGLKEQDIDIRDRGEYDREGDMALNQVHQIADAVEELHSILAADENLPEWVQAKITKALDYIDTSRDYLKAKGEQYTDRGQEPIAEKSVSRAQQKFMGMVHAAKKGAKPASAAVAKVARGMSGKDAEDFAATKHKGLPAKKSDRVEEETTDTRDQHAEKAGKRVTKDLEYDMKHKGKDDAKAEKAGKRVTKDIEYDEKKKEKKVDETTVSGSVATSSGGDAPKKGKGGMQFGKGVYEGAMTESYNRQLNSVLNEGYSVNVSVDDGGRKNITVTASDEQADQLGQMLKMAGLFSSEGYSQVCEQCHGIHEAGACGAEQVEEELANSPDEVYTDADYMTQTLSGGLNGPKTTGQTTGPVVNRQDSRQGVMAEAERVVEQSESRLWNLYKQYDKK
jgi:hypothetical protein